MKTCREVMTSNVTCCLSTDTVDLAAQLMNDENIGSVPVVESGNGRLVGIVTDRDLAIKVVAEGRDPKSTRVSDVMTSKLVTCSPHDGFDKAIESMQMHQIRRIAVCDDTGRIVGIIAQADVATKSNEPRKTGEMVERISEPSTAAMR